ncbi:MAG: heme-binding protein [Pseudomonadota bacterium]
MKRIRKTVIWMLGAGAVCTAVAAGAWIYATSNVEVPPYVIAETDGDVEIRDYPPLVVAEVTTTGPRREAVRAGFGPLAGYIFARERPGEKIAMTAPVTQRAEGNGAWTVQFIMPEGYSLEDLPAPSGSTVSLNTEPALRRAAIRFSGSWSDALFAEKEAALRAWLTARGQEPSGPAIFAYYNDPFTPGFLRRNEVIFDLGPAG